MRRHLSLASALIALALAVPMRGLAQEEPSAPPDAAEEPPPSPELAEAMERFEGAQRLFDAGDFRGALAEFQRIYELLEGHPNQFFVLFNLGRAYEELHRYDRAIEMYRRYLDEGGSDAEDRGDVEASLRALERLLGTVSITLSGQPRPETAEVWMGEWQVGEAPGEVHIPGGQHVIELRAQGYETLRRTIEVAARQRLELDLQMARLSDFRGVTPGLFVASTALAVASLGVAIGLGVNALMLSDDAEQCRETPRCTLDVPGRRQEIQDFALAADVMYGAAGLFAVTSVVLIFVTDWGSMPEPELMEREGAVSVLPVLGPQHAGLATRVRF